jgi:predicted transcriptional regulator
MHNHYDDEEASGSTAPAITVRLEADLAERLREFCYRRRLKKQPVLRLAVQRFIELVNGAAKQKRAAMLERLRFAPDLPLEAKEKLVFDRADFEILRKFVYEHNTYKQHVVRIALIDYLDSQPKP